MAEEPSPLAAMFELRYKEAWKIWRDGNNDAAEAKARDLLLEPRLGRFHQAGMHLLLSTASDYYVEHALEAVRLFTEISARQDLTDKAREGITACLRDANKMLNRARRDQTRIDREIQKKLDAGMTMDELHQAQIDEMHKRFEAEETFTDMDSGEDPEEDSGSRSQTIPDSQDIPGMTDDSQRTESQRTESQRTDPQNVVIEMDLDDDDPLPDIVRYNFGAGQKKGTDEL